MRHRAAHRARCMQLAIATDRLLHIQTVHPKHKYKCLLSAAACPASGPGLIPARPTIGTEKWIFM
jgi:hypothetical protein